MLQPGFMPPPRQVYPEVEESAMANPLLITHRSHGTRVAIVFLHGFGGDPAATWGKFPAFIAGEPGLADWDIFSIGYDTRFTPVIVGIWSANAPLDRLAFLL